MAILFLKAHSWRLSTIFSTIYSSLLPNGEAFIPNSSFGFGWGLLASQIWALLPDAEKRCHG